MNLLNLSIEQVNSLGVNGCYLNYAETEQGAEWKLSHLNCIHRFFRWLGCCYANTHLKKVSDRLVQEVQLPEVIRAKMFTIFDRTYPGELNPFKPLAKDPLIEPKFPAETKIQERLIKKKRHIELAQEDAHSPKAPRLQILNAPVASIVIEEIKAKVQEVAIEPAVEQPPEIDPDTPDLEPIALPVPPQPETVVEKEDVARDIPDPVPEPFDLGAPPATRRLTAPLSLRGRKARVIEGLRHFPDDKIFKTPLGQRKWNLPPRLVDPDSPKRESTLKQRVKAALTNKVLQKMVLPPAQEITVSINGYENEGKEFFLDQKEEHGKG